jgi:transcriptional regulator with XRE-family HTH domain
MRFGEKLSLLRKRRGMTQLELAEELNVSRQAVSRWEQGISNPSTENMVRIGKLLDVSIDTLVNENAQLQTETAVLVVEAEEKKAVERHDKRGILKIVGIVLLVVAAVLVVCIWLAKDTQNPVPMEDINKSEVNVSEAVTLPIELKE